MTNPPPARRLALDVRVYGELVGHLHRDREGRTRFSPDASWLSRGQRPPLGLAFLAQPGPRLAGTGLPLWLIDLDGGGPFPVAAHRRSEPGSRAGPLAPIREPGPRAPGALR